MEVITENIKDAPISIIGFGKFETKHRTARKQKSPQDGKIIDVPACNRVSFKAGQGLRDAVN